jgi:hypothetical protein
MLTVAMATDEHATMDNHATVEAFSLWSVPRQQLGSGVFFVVCSQAILVEAVATEINVRSRDPHGARIQDLLTD